MHIKRGYSNKNYLKYPIKIKNRSSLRETSFSRRPIYFKKWQRYTILIQLHTLSLVIVKKLNILHTLRAKIHTPISER